jgi:wyosine [tRNA(Phe)-imidazoG37] synthetase (radical SAM superfamily)
VALPLMNSKTVNLFTVHSRFWESNRYVYPVISRRSKGLSIGVNLNPDKACNFDCIYCCVDRTVPPSVREVDLTILRTELEQMLALTTTGMLWSTPPFDQTPLGLRRLNDIAFSGDGEPTSFPQFQQACELSASLLQQASLADVKLVVITNATLFHRPRVARALEFLDVHHGEIWAKLDAGTEEYYRLVERSSVPLQRVLDNILAAGRVRPIVIQSLFMEIHDQPPSDDEIAAFVDRLRQLKTDGCQIKLVQVYTVARRVTESYVTALEPARLDRIAQLISQIPLPAEVYYGPS